jgi:hypothetical protein
MTRRPVCALLVLWSAAALAQEASRPDFSGTWLLDKGKSRLQVPTPDSSVVYIDHAYSRFWLTRALVVDGEADMLKIRAFTDGDESVENWQDGTVVHRGRWEGNRLVLESRDRRGRKHSLTVVRYSLSPDGKTLTAEERFAGPDRKYENTWVFQRESPATLDVTESDLAEIKAAVLQYYETRKPENWEGFSEELRRGAIFPIEKDQSPRIGIFTVEKKDDRLALIRQPPVASNMFYFGFFLAKLDGQWVVLEDYFEHERTNYEDPREE